MSADWPLWTIYLAAAIPAAMVRGSAHASSKSWSLTTRQRSVRDAPDGLPQISTFTIWHSIHEAGYTWQQNRTWCKTGTTLHQGKDGVEERHDPYTQEKKR
jgi:hypothetical protein